MQVIYHKWQEGLKNERTDLRKITQYLHSLNETFDFATSNVLADFSKM
jgi:hypothetical protein